MIDTLTPHELRSLVLLAYGYTEAEVAERMAISRQTVKNLNQRTYRKLRVRNRVGAFLALGWLMPPETDDA